MLALSCEWHIEAFNTTGLLNYKRLNGALFGLSVHRDKASKPLISLTSWNSKPDERTQE